MKFSMITLLGLAEASATAFSKEVFTIVTTNINGGTPGSMKVGTISLNYNQDKQLSTSTVWIKGDQPILGSGGWSTEPIDENPAPKSYTQWVDGDGTNVYWQEDNTFYTGILNDDRISGFFSTTDGANGTFGAELCELGKTCRTDMPVKE